MEPEGRPFFSLRSKMRGFSGGTGLKTKDDVTSGKNGRSRNKKCIGVLFGFMGPPPLSCSRLQQFAALSRLSASESLLLLLAFGQGGRRKCNFCSVLWMEEEVSPLCCLPPGKCLFFPDKNKGTFRPSPSPPPPKLHGSGVTGGRRNEVALSLSLSLSPGRLLRTVLFYSPRGRKQGRWFSRP